MLEIFYFFKIIFLTGRGAFSRLCPSGLSYEQMQIFSGIPEIKVQYSGVRYNSNCRNLTAISLKSGIRVIDCTKAENFIVPVLVVVIRALVERSEVFPPVSCDLFVGGFGGFSITSENVDDSAVVVVVFETVLREEVVDVVDFLLRELKIFT